MAFHRIWLFCAALFVAACEGEQGQEQATSSVLSRFERAKVEQARVQAMQLAKEAYVHWALATRKECPASIDELLEYVSRRDVRDPWGNDFELLCGQNKPPEIGDEVGVRSRGPDGEAGTADDVMSWR